MSTDTHDITDTETAPQRVSTPPVTRLTGNAPRSDSLPCPDTLPSIERQLAAENTLPTQNLIETVELPKDQLKITSNFSLFDSSEDQSLQHQHDPRMDLPTTPCDLDTYTLTELSAEGGTARIYRAFESHSKERVAIKLLRRRFQNDSFISKLFKRHGEALKQLDVPYFAKVLDTGDSPWGPWWALEWVEGHTLRAAIDRGTHWSSNRLFKLMIQLCEALEGLHKMNITHGDLNANNVMYTPSSRPEDSERLTLIDLALPIKLHLADDVQKLDGLQEEDDHERHSTEQRMSDELRVFGQPIYLAPECLKGQQPNYRTDLYSLGMVFFELTTGTLPFQTKLPGVIYDVLMKNAPAASMIQKPWPYPPSLDALIGNLLSKVPQERCGSVQEVKEQLSQMMSYLQAPRYEFTNTDELSVDELEQAFHHEIEETLSGLMNDDFRAELLSLTKTSEPSTSSQQVQVPYPKTKRSEHVPTKPPHMSTAHLDPYDPKNSSSDTPHRSLPPYSSVKSTPQYTPSPRSSLSSARRSHIESSTRPIRPWIINVMWMFVGMGVTLLIRYLW